MRIHTVTNELVSHSALIIVISVFGSSQPNGSPSRYALLPLQSAESTTSPISGRNFKATDSE